MRFGPDEEQTGEVPLQRIRQEKFCISYVKHGSAGNAALDAGYSPKSKNLPYDLLKKPHIKARIMYLRTRIEDDTVKGEGITRKWVEEQLVENVLEAKKLSDYKAANQALHLIGKDKGMFVERVLSGEMEEELKGKSEAELEEYLKGAFEELGPSAVKAIIDQHRTQSAGTADTDSADGESAEDESSSSVSTVSEAEGVSRSRVH